MTELARRAFSGCRDQVARARQFVAGELAGCPVADEAILCVSELATNALMHTASGDGGKFEVIVQRWTSLARVSVCDQGSTGTRTRTELRKIKRPKNQSGTKVARRRKQAS